MAYVSLGAAVVGSLVSLYLCAGRRKVPLESIAAIQEGKVHQVSELEDAYSLINKHEKVVLYLHADW